MPLFNFKCNKCNNEFEELITIADKIKIKCPKCNNTKITKLVAKPLMHCSDGPGNTTRNSVGYNSTGSGIGKV